MVLSLLFSLTMMLCLLLTAAEILLYRTPGWFEKEYDQYMGLEGVRGEMSMKSALQVTEEMMDYLKGDRKNLTVMTTIDGKQQEFRRAKCSTISWKSWPADGDASWAADSRYRWIRRVGLREARASTTRTSIRRLRSPMKTHWFNHCTRAC